MRKIILMIKNWWARLMHKKRARYIATLVKNNGVMDLRNLYVDEKITYDDLLECYAVLKRTNPTRKTIHQITEMLNSTLPYRQ